MIELPITHETPSIIDYDITTKHIVESIKNRLRTTTAELEIPLNDALDLVDQLSEFDLGRFLLHNRSLNGYWTAHIFRNNAEAKVHPLKHWLLNKTLLTCARERFYRFKKIIQDRLRSNMVLASIPCGLMDELLTLNYKNYNSVKIIGIDLDQESIYLAKENATANELLEQTNFLKKNAWDLNIFEQYDLISSNGLNMYEPDYKKNIILYENFYKALKSSGVLVISFLPPPPDGTDPNYTWDNFGIDLKDIKREITIFSTILQAKFLNFCTEYDMVQQLESVGFKIEEINYSATHVLPIAIARK